ncbi:hypothetical protein F4810DRAFT_668042 [Camillea tinctor]|nr:hypothetical protein F4810DRAFT_668042 [Camillea tinctor]
MEDVIIVGISTIVPTAEKIITPQSNDSFPVTSENELIKTPSELTRHKGLQDLDVWAILSKGANFNGGGAETESWEEWMTDELKGDSKAAFDTIKANISRYLIFNTEKPNLLDSTPKVLLKTDLVNGNADTFGERLLWHIIRYYPKICHPKVEAGSWTLEKLVHLIKYLKTEDCKKRNGYRVTDEGVRKVFAKYCESAYPYPVSGSGGWEILLRYQFLCFNKFALKLARSEVITDSGPALYALNALNIESPDGTRRFANPESILVACEWLVFFNPEFPGMFGQKGWNSLWLHAYYCVVGSQQLYEEPPPKLGMNDYFLKHLTAIDEVRSTITVCHLKYWGGCIEGGREGPKETRNKILNGCDIEGCHTLCREIRDLCKQKEAVEDSGKETELMSEAQATAKVEIVCGLVPIAGASKVANALVNKILSATSLRLLAEQATLRLKSGRRG